MRKVLLGLSSALTALGLTMVALAPDTSTQAPLGPPSDTAQLVALRQSATVKMLPPISARGTKPASSAAARTPFEATLRPIRKGRVVDLQGWKRGAWRNLATTRQTAQGTAWFSLSPTQMRAGHSKYRVRARAAYRTPVFASAAVSRTTWRSDFGDEFSGTRLNLDKWDYRYPGLQVGSRQQSVPDPRAVRVGGGTVQLMAAKRPAGSPYPREVKYINGVIGTQGKYDLTRGVIAARIKFPVGRGQHGSLWMQPDQPGSFPGNPARSGAEIDIVEFFGKGYPKGGLSSFIYYLDAKNQQKKVGGVWPQAQSLIPRGDTWWNSYHVFSVEWERNRYTFRVDGKKLFTTTQGVSGIDQYLILSLLTSDWELPDLNKSSLPTRMHVDWVKTWQRR